jgi:hypothetical protein
MFREITIEPSLVEAVRRVNLGELLGWLHGFEIPMLEDICLADSMAPGSNLLLLGVRFAATGFKSSWSPRKL